ncbi:hypothetical protein CMK22_20620 [Candidatus Poribacteria bacterium]|nr:hypothetical protein [Candidatus Poribacteria bacterium]
MKSKRYIIPLALILLVVGIVVMLPYLRAERPVTEPEKAKISSELIEALKIWKLIHAVSPTTEQLVPLLAKFNELEELKKIYRQNHRQIYDQLKRLQDDMRDVDVSQKVLDDYRQIEEQFIHQRREIKSEINKILTVDQQMKFEVFSFTYRRDLRKTMQLLLSLQKVDVKSQSK